MAEIAQNILYITREGVYLHHELELLKVKEKDETLLKIPLHHLRGITFFGRGSMSPSLLQKCLQKGIFVTYLNSNGRFLGRLEGSGAGNVLLRKEQILKSEQEEFSLNVARAFLAGKIQNARLNLMRTAREIQEETQAEELRAIAEKLNKSLKSLKKAADRDSLRGHEGDAARAYFSVFDHCITSQKDDFQFQGRTKRPPRSRVNALLSFYYSLLTNDCMAACQSCGLDPFVGFLHRDRPGRPSLALDLVEEFRAFADRIVLTLINRKQIQAKDIHERPGSVYSLTDDSRKKVITVYQERKQDEIHHPLLDIKVRIGELPFYQARVLSRVIRGELPEYIPFLWK